MNYLRTTVLLALLTAFFGFVGYLVAGTGGMLLAFLIATGMNLFTFWNSDKVVLRQYGARLVTRQSQPELVEMVEELASRADLPAPKVFVIDMEQPNAFATGRNHENAAVAVTSGLVKHLNREELSGVVAHELAHIKNYDTLTMTITASIAGAISMLANFSFFFRGANGRSNSNPLTMLLVVFLAPLAAAVVQMAISRTREYAADKLGGEICGNPLWLASALSKLGTIATGISSQRAEKHPETAHLFIINPLTGNGRDRLFSTHPNTENRIKALREHYIDMYGSIPQNTGDFAREDTKPSSHSRYPGKPGPKIW